ncbi:MerR type regulator [Halalkalibacter alkalisediminis]|uniref:MerR type regulator n=1 Tax=Halalkalibacter alkalisediminis TaxID=935616 RepID=A0ABV6NJ44_9BACI|nr:MerR type regulator [Halalkalibacter alkalisediminis]
MKQDFLLKTVILLIGIAVIVGAFVGFRVYDEAQSEIDSLQATIEQQENQISLLELSNQGLDEEYQDNEANNISETVRAFINALYDVRDGKGEARRTEAELVVTQEMLEEYFPETEQEVALSMEYRVKKVNVYPSVEQKSVFVVMEGSTVNLNNGQREDNRITLQVFLQKEGEKWIVNKFQQIHAEPL